jgi:hypothetical protein
MFSFCRAWPAGKIQLVHPNHMACVDMCPSLLFLQENHGRQSFRNQKVSPSTLRLQCWYSLFKPAYQTASQTVRLVDCSEFHYKKHEIEWHHLHQPNAANRQTYERPLSKIWHAAVASQQTRTPKKQSCSKNMPEIVNSLILKFVCTRLPEFLGIEYLCLYSKTAEQPIVIPKILRVTVKWE